MQVKPEEYVKEWLEPVVRFVDMPERKIKRNIALMQSRVKCIKKPEQKDNGGNKSDETKESRNI